MSKRKPETRTSLQRATDWMKARATKRGLPWQLYGGRTAPVNVNVTLRQVKREAKSLLDMMDKRYKSAIKRGVPLSEVLILDRGSWGKISQIKTVGAGIAQIRQMVAALLEKGTGAEMAKKISAKRLRQLKGLKEAGRVPDYWTMEHMKAFYQFLQKRCAKLTAEQYYKLLMMWNEVEYGTVDDETARLFKSGGWDKLIGDFESTYARMEEFTFKRDYMQGSKGVSLSEMDKIINGGRPSSSGRVGTSGKAGGGKKKR